jgi:Glycosyl transferases group 1
MRVFMWHVHGSYQTSLVQGAHEYLLPVVPDRGPDGRGRAQTWDWPRNAIEVTPEEAADVEVDVLIVQRPHELELAERWLGGRRVPTIYLEHTSPQGAIAEMRHPAADRDDLLVVHVTHFNALFWDTGTAATRVIEHGIVDPGYRYTGELPRAAVAINEPVRRGRVTGTDLLPRLNGEVALDVFGIGAGEIGGIEDVPQARLHDEFARRRVYLHPIRWTSLGLTLLEAMHLGMPVVALATTEVAEAVPPSAGVVTNRIDELRRALRELVADPGRARECGRAAREAALDRYGLERFLADWDATLEEVASR